MDQDIYERLANALDALPNRYPRTKSGVEIRLIKKAFTSEEAELAGQMSRTYETVAEIARRGNMPEAKAKEMLDKMLPRALVARNEVGGVERFRLGQFIIGWYERHFHAHVAPTDKEFAQMFEQYLVEGGAAEILGSRPGIMRVVPVRGSLKKELLQPCDDIDAHFQRYERFMVQNCICRIQQNLLDSKCKLPVKRCAFVGLPPQAPLSDNVLNREQALKLFGELEEMGHVHLGFFRAPVFAGCCNCCGCCCGVLRGITDVGLPEAPQRSNYRAMIDLEKCNACGNCIEYCQVHAITEDKGGMPHLNRAKCIGCGQCVIKCPTDAVELVPVSAAEWFKVPNSYEEWEEMRLQSRAKGS